MKNFTMEDLKRLAAIEAETCISIYMPTDPAAATTDEQRIRFKNLLRQAEKTLRKVEPKKKELSEALEKGWRLWENDFFWRHQSDGLAVFIAPGVFSFYRLPLSFTEALTVSKRFAVKPLIPLFMADRRFYILALSQAHIRLFSCTRHNIMEIELIDIPGGIAESLQYERKQSQLQFHTPTAGGSGGPGPAVYHGHGMGSEDRKDEILRYFQDVDRRLATILPDREAPLMLAGVEYLLPIFREVTTYREVMKEAISGNPDLLRPEELHEKALGIMGPELERNRREASQRYSELAGRGYTAAGVRAVVPAAAYGRVDTLFVALDERRPGAFERSNNQVMVTEGEDATGEDLLDLAAAETIKNGGQVFAIRRAEMPEEHAAAAAILRY